MKKLRKRILVLGITFMTLFCGTLTVHATTKTAGVRIEKGYVWIMSTLYVDYKTSKEITGANMKRAYTYPGVTNARERATSLKTYSATGQVWATLAGEAKTNSVTYRTK